MAKLGVLRCCFYLNRQQETIDIATQILNDELIGDAIREEALYNRAKAFVATGQYGMAVVDLDQISKEVRTSTGAEAKYLTAECYYNLGALDKSEEEIMAFMQMETQQQYWLAKALILLSDINLSRGEDFQARQYLITLQNNYRGQDDILSTVAEKMKILDSLHKNVDPLAQVLQLRPAELLREEDRELLPAELGREVAGVALVELHAALVLRKRAGLASDRPLRALRAERDGHHEVYLHVLHSGRSLEHPV